MIDILMKAATQEFTYCTTITVVLDILLKAAAKFTYNKSGGYIAEDNQTYRRGLLTTILVDILLDTARLTVEFTYNNTGSDGYTVFLKTARNRVKFTYNNSGGHILKGSLTYSRVLLTTI
jgi:hypothetical protein